MFNESHSSSTKLHHRPDVAVHRLAASICVYANSFHTVEARETHNRPRLFIGALSICRYFDQHIPIRCSVSAVHIRLNRRENFPTIESSVCSFQCAVLQELKDSVCDLSDYLYYITKLINDQNYPIYWISCNTRSCVFLFCISIVVLSSPSFFQNI